MKNKNLIWGAVAAGFLVLCAQVNAAVIGHTELDGVVYFLDEGDSDALLRYDIATESTLSSISFAATPTAIASDELGVYVAVGKSLYLYSFTGNVASTPLLLRHFATNVKQIHAVGNYLLVVSGSPSQTVTVIERADGSFVNETIFGDGEFGVIAGIHYSPSNGYLVINFESSVDETVFLTSDFNTTNGSFAAFESSAINVFSEPYFFEGAGIVVGKDGAVAKFGGAGVTSFAPAIDSNASFFTLEGHEQFYSDSVVKTALEDGNEVLIASSIDNNCHEFDGGTTIRKVTVSYDDSDPVDPDKDALVLDEIIDVNADIHSIVGDGADYLLFSGSANALSMQRYLDLEDPEFFGSTAFEPLKVNFTPDQHLSAVSADGDTLIMHIEASCDRHIVRWSMSQQAYLPSVIMEINKPVDASYSAVNNRFYSLTNANDSLQLRFVDFNSEPLKYEYVYSAAGAGNQVVATDNFVVLSFKAADGGEQLGAWNMDKERVALVDIESAWDVGVWDSFNDKIYYLSGGELFSVEQNGDGTFGDTVKSLHYGEKQTASVDSEIVVSGDGKFLMVGGHLYDTNSLIQMDAIGEDPESAMWLGDSVYTFFSGVESSLMHWVLDQGTDDHLGSADPTVLSGINVLLFPMILDGVSVPLTLTQSDTGALTYRTHGDNSTSLTLGGNGEAGAGNDSGTDSTDTDTSQPAEPIGGTGGGSIDYMYLLLLTLGFTVRLRKLN